LWELVHRGIQHHGGDPNYARNLRPLLFEAGFERVEGGASVLSFGSGDAAGRSSAEALRARLQGPTETTAIEQGWATRQEVDGIYNELERWAEQSNTFMAVLLCSGLGWVPA
jgi:hypothetical protein